MSKSFEQCVKLGVSVAVILVVVGGIVPGADKLLPLGGNPLAQIGACVGLAIGIFGVWSFFGGNSDPARPADTARPGIDGPVGPSSADGAPNRRSAAIVDELKGKAAALEPAVDRTAECVRETAKSASQDLA